MNRRRFLTAVLATMSAPAIVRASSLMPVRARSWLPAWRIDAEDGTLWTVGGNPIPIPPIDPPGILTFEGTTFQSANGPFTWSGGWTRTVADFRHCTHINERGETIAMPDQSIVLEANERYAFDGEWREVKA